MQVNTYKWAIGAMLVLLIGVPCLAADGIVYVDARAAGANDGTSWENAYGYLQDALAAAESFDASLEIRVARGTYRPDNGAGILPGDRHAAFDLRGGVILMGGYAGLGAADPDARDVETWRTVLSGDLAGNDIPLNDLQWQTLFDYATDATLGDNSIAVVTAMDSADETAVLDGFTITAGYANVNSHASPSYRRDGGGGGGLCCAEGSPVIRDCTFRRNTAYCTAVEICRGGGMANFAGSPTLMGCTFEENISFGQGLSGFGGAVYNDQGGDGTFTDCLFRANVAAGWNSA